MDSTSLFQMLLESSTSNEVSAAVNAFVMANRERAAWAPIGGKENNRGPIEISADPGRSLVERLTNGIDAILEAEYDRHRGIPDCRSPRQAATTWMDVSERGLSDMTPAQRQAIAKRIIITLSQGSGREKRLVEVRDLGIGLAPDEMATTILSLNESNKIRKHYLAGTYGQGGSSTFAISGFTLIVSRKRGSRIGFTVVKFLDLPPDEYKTGHYVYLTLDGAVLVVERSEEEFSNGTLVRHFGYDLSSYSSPVGPNSVYGLLNQVLFDPVLPIWLNSEVHGYRRVIKGSRNALNGAVDEGDDQRRGPTLDHNVPTFYVSLGDFGRVGIEYWVLERPTRANKRPSAAFVNPIRPIILTLNGQNHAELSAGIIRKEAELPYLASRLIVHVDSDSLTPAAKRALFASSREDARRGQVLNLVHSEIVRVLKSDDELVRLNNAAREQGMRDRDESAVQEMRREVARLLRIQGIHLGPTAGVRPGGDGPNVDRPPPQRPTRPPRPPQPIEAHEPPTYVRIVWDQEEPIGFYPGQRRYMRIETDANSSYYTPDNPTASRINIILQGLATLKGSTPLSGGRMRAILEVAEGTAIGAEGTMRVELSRPGMPTLWDQRGIVVHDPPPAQPGRQHLSLPHFETRPVAPEDNQWAELGWPDDVSMIASSAEMEEGTLVIYYSTAYPKFTVPRSRYEQRNASLAESFTKRYEIWLATHSLIYHQDQIDASARQVVPDEDDSEVLAERERQERCRIGTLAALFAAREIDLAAMSPSEVEV